MSAILQGDSIRTALVVFDVEQGNRSPGITTVAAETGGKFGIMGTHQNLQSANLQLQDRWLDTVDISRLLTLLVDRMLHIHRSRIHIIGTRLQFGIYRTHILPLFGLQVENLHMESPTLVLGTGTADESAVHHFRLVLDRTEETVWQSLRITPGLTAILRFHKTARPVTNGSSHLIEQPYLAIRHSIEHRVPARLALQIGRQLDIG